MLTLGVHEAKIKALVHFHCDKSNWSCTHHNEEYIGKQLLPLLEHKPKQQFKVKMSLLALKLIMPRCACASEVYTSLDSSPLNSGPGIYCWRVGGQYLPYFISLNIKTVFYLIVIKNRKEKGEATSLYIL